MQAEEGTPVQARPDAAAGGPQAAAAQKLPRAPAGAATPFARLRRPAALTPVMRRARAVHAEVLALSQCRDHCSARQWDGNAEVLGWCALPILISLHAQ